MTHVYAAMSTIKGIYCHPGRNPEKRFAIGIKGKKNLLFIGLNPNTANENKLDSTSRNVQRIALDNGFDGWCLVNLYPARSPKGGRLNQIANRELFHKNIVWIESLAAGTAFPCADVLLGWGDDIKEKPYFKRSICMIYHRLRKYDLKYFSFRVNQSGNPGHPSPMVINTRYKSGEPIRMSPFDFPTYVKRMKSDLFGAPSSTPYVTG